MKFSKIANYVAFTALVQALPESTDLPVSAPPTDGKFFYLDMSSPSAGLDLHIGSELQELKVALNTQRSSLALYTTACDKKACTVPSAYD